MKKTMAENGELLSAHCGTASRFALCRTPRFLHGIFMQFGMFSAFVSDFAPWHFRICFGFRASDFGFAEIPLLWSHSYIGISEKATLVSCATAVFLLYCLMRRRQTKVFLALGWYEPSHLLGISRSPSRGTRLRDTLFFLCVWLYLWQIVDPRLIACCAVPPSGILPVFFRGTTFFRKFVALPGGLAEYAGAFLFQLYSSAWLGAIVITGLAWLLSLCVRGCFTESVSPRLQCLRYVPALLVLAIHSGYSHCIIGIVALLAVLCVVPAYRGVGSRGAAMAVIFFVLVSPVLYYVAGAAYLVFAATCILFEMVVTRRWWLAAAYLLVAVAVPYLVGVVMCGTPVAAALTPSAVSWRAAGPNAPLWAVYCLYLLVPAGMLVSRGVERMASWSARIPPRLRQTGLALPFALAAGTAAVSFVPREKAVRLVDFYAQQGMWNRALEVAREDPFNPAIVQTIPRALCHTGRLADELFSHPQSLSVLLIDPRANMSWQWTDIWLDAGFVNAAEHHLAQALEVFGEQPAILQKLAVVHLAKGNTGTARIYLEALTRTLSGAAWAGQRLRELETDPNLANDRQIQWLRGTMPSTTALIKEHTPDEWFITLLDRNPTNRPAFEYLMTMYLVAPRPDLVVHHIHRLEVAGYVRPYLPEHYAEAVVAHTARSGAQPDLHGWKVRPETVQRYQACAEIERRFKNDPAALRRALWERFPGSYFRYLMIGEEGRP